MGGGGLEYLASAEGLVDQWEFLFGVWFLVCFYVHHAGVYLAWVVIVGVFMGLSFIVIILKCFGVELPKMLLLIFYILGAVLVLLITLIGGSIHGGGIISPDCWCLSFSMGIFYIYAAIVSQGK